MEINRYILFALAAMPAAAGIAQSRSMTIDEADSIAVRNNLQLRAVRLDVDAAEGQLAQARKYENPEVQLMHNVQNPENRRWFDTGREGQTDIQLAQPIAIGGQRRSRVRRAEAELNAARAGCDAAALEVRCDVRTTFIDLYNAQQKLKVYDKEIASAEKIHTVYSEQTDKGNVSRMQTFRIAAMLQQLRSEKAELLLSASGHQARLGQLLGISGTEAIEARLDEGAAIRAVEQSLAGMQPLMMQPTPELLRGMVQANPGIIQAKHQEEGARHAVRAERADALPRITLNGEWDKNGSIGHNFFAVGATLTVPLWNRNQGNIRSAKVQHVQAAIERQQKEDELLATLLAAYRAARQNQRLVEEQKQLSADLDSLFDAAEEQFLKRNISVVEFVDLYASYRDTKFQIEDTKAQLLKNSEELRKYITK